jgi:hypothetical protein
MSRDRRPKGACRAASKSRARRRDRGLLATTLRLFGRRSPSEPTPTAGSEAASGSRSFPKSRQAESCARSAAWFRHVPLGVQAKLTPALIKTSFRKLIRVDHSGRSSVPIDIGRGRKDMWLIVGHMTFRPARSAAAGLSRSPHVVARESWYPIGARIDRPSHDLGHQKAPFPGPFPIAGAGFEPATFGL